MKTKITEKVLRENKFRRCVFDTEHWWERKIGGFTFLTNDSFYNKGKDDWHIGFYNKDMNDPAWLKNGKTLEGFKALVFGLTGKEI